MNHADLIHKLEALHSQMIDVATEMDYYGGFSEIATHGAQLAGAAAIVQTWIDGMKEPA